MKILLLAKYKTENYVAAVEALGHESVLSCDDLSDVDGVILCGGSDVDPAYYGQGMNGARNIDRARDEREVKLGRECIRRGIPTLGICRGLQLLNVLFGGTLIQHLPNEEYHNKPGSERYISHEVMASEDSLFRVLYGEQFVVNTSHHQAIDILGEGLRATLFAPDGVIEGVEHTTLPIFAVQWHPERMMPPLCEGEMADGARVFLRFFQMIEENKSC